MDLWYTRADSAGTRWCIAVVRPLGGAGGADGRVEAFESADFGTILAVDGAIALTEAEGFTYREMMVHPAMAAHRGARSALVVGGGDGALVSELLRHPGLERIAVTEDDEGYAEAARRFFPGLAAALSDPRVIVAEEQGEAFVRDCRERFDLILVGSREGRREGAAGQSFFCDCFRALSGDGILVSQLGSAFFPERRRELVGAAGRLKRLFPVFRPYYYVSQASGTGASILAFASKKYDPIRDFSAERWEALGLATRYYGAEVHGAAFALPRYMADAIREA